MGYLSPEERAIVDQARRLQLLSDSPPAYLSPNLCTALSLVLAIPTLGFSLLFVPIVWVAQYDHTARKIATLKIRIAAVAPVTLTTPADRA